MALKHAFVSGKTDGGDSTLVQPSNWNADHSIDSSGLVIPVNTGTPTAPAADNLTVFAREIANRAMISQLGPNASESAMQPFLGRNRIGYLSSAGNTTNTPSGNWIEFTTFVGTVTARNVATTNALTRMRRFGLVSATTAGSFSNFRGGSATTGQAQFTTGNAATYPLGGFFFVARFGISDSPAVSGARMFIGMHSSTAAPTNVNPDTMLNCAGIAQLSSDATQLYIVYGGSAAQTAIALGATNFSLSTSVPYELALFAPSTVSGAIYYQVTNLANGSTATGTLSGASTVVPASTTLLCPHFWRTNNAGVSAVGIDICSLYIETDQ